MMEWACHSPSHNRNHKKRGTLALRKEFPTKAIALKSSHITATVAWSLTWGRHMSVATSQVKWTSCAMHTLGMHNYILISPHDLNTFVIQSFSLLFFSTYATNVGVIIVPLWLSWKKILISKYFKLSVKTSNLVLHTASLKTRGELLVWRAMALQPAHLVCSAVFSNRSRCRRSP
jgi:hypothetical protein